MNIALALLLTSHLSFCYGLRIGQHQAPITQSSPLGNYIASILRQNEIIGDVLDEFDPIYRIIAAYSRSHQQVQLGNYVPEEAVQSRPAFEFAHLESIADPPDNSTFTLILTDPDATSRDDPKMSEMCHWIITNLTMETGLSQDVQPINTLRMKEGELKSYYPPAPPKGTGRHRYVFVLLKGNSTKTPNSPEDRPHWGYGKVRHGVRDWAKENDLEVVGANFFVTQHGSS